MENISTLLDTGIKIRQVNPAEALIIFNQAYQLARESADEKNIVESVFNMAIVYLNLANYSESLRHFMMTLDYDYTHNNPKLIAEVHRGIATQYLRTYNYKEALKYLYRAESLSIDANHLDNLHSIYGSFGSLYNKLKFYEKALEYTLKSLRLAEQIGSEEMIQYSKMSVGACYYQL